MKNFDSRKQLRKELRARRNALSKQQQINAAQQLTKRLKSHAVFLRSKHIAFYMADDGEINTRHLMRAAEKMGKYCYLPVLHPLKHNTLWFCRYRKGDDLLINRFGLEEPLSEKSIFPAWALDLVLMPLVGFDRQGNRLGMGGGFYDRAFSFINHNKRISKKPLLMGIAHQCQEVQELASADWDIRLNFIATNKEIISV